jgi:hypothetical protein
MELGADGKMNFQQQPEQVLPKQVSKQMGRASQKLVQLGLHEFSRGGPTLFTRNHPQQAKRKFTAAFIDEAMQAENEKRRQEQQQQQQEGEDRDAQQGEQSQPQPAAPSLLPLLPSDLLLLIADYHSLELPFLPQEAEEQMEAAGWEQLSAASQPAYPGQRWNGVELAYSLALEVLFPSILLGS